MTLAALEIDAPAAEPAEARVPSYGETIRRRFMRHKLAVAGAVIVALAYLVVVFADFLAYADPRASDAQRALAAPQQIHFLEHGQLSLHVDALIRSRDPASLKPVYVADPTRPIPVRLFTHGYHYRLFGLIPTDLHLFGQRGGDHQDLFIIGSDQLGRDLFSRLVVGVRTSLTIGLAAVCVSLVLGTAMGALSGYFGGWMDLAIQRLIEFVRAVPTIPLWMALAAAIPPSWSVSARYMAVTLIIALIGWTELARELRGRMMQLRREEFVLAAELSGARPVRIMFTHLLPLCASHIIAATTLAVPAMIASETALGFLGLGLRAPAISLGVLLNGAENVQTFALYPWLLWPVAPTALVIIAFNFLGDGLRDAADPNA